MDYSPKKKSDAYEATIEFLEMVKTQYNVIVMEWFSDDGGEYISAKNTALLKGRGIGIFHSVPYMHQMNGCAEQFTAVCKIPGGAAFFGLKSKFEKFRVPMSWASYFHQFSSYDHYFG